MAFFIRWCVSFLALGLVIYLLPGITVDSLGATVLAALVLSLANALLRPLLIILTLPFTVLSLGLFVLVINAFLFYLTAVWVPGFRVDGFGTAFAGSLLHGIIGLVLTTVFGTERPPSRFRNNRRRYREVIDAEFREDR
jgi:putative membrane protein